MNYINEIINNGNIQDTIRKILDDSYQKNLRYSTETLLLKYCIMNQLNLPKNNIKGPLEKYNLSQLFNLLLEEIYELKSEIREDFNIEPIRVLEEIGDIGAFLVGILSKILWMKNNESL